VGGPDDHPLGSQLKVAVAKAASLISKLRERRPRAGPAFTFCMHEAAVWRTAQLGEQFAPTIEVFLEIGRENALHYTASGKNHPCEFSLVPLSSTRHLDHYAHDFDEFRTARSLSQVQWRDLTKRCNFERNLPREPRRPMGCARAAMPVRQVSRLLSHPKFSRH
jgi:hypothetical protein